MRKKIAALICLLAAACLVLSGCKMVSSYALKVNDTYYTVDEVAEEVQEHLAESDQEDEEPDVAATKQHVADELIRDAVIRQKIEAYGIALTEEELAAAKESGYQQREEAIENDIWNTYMYYAMYGYEVTYEAMESTVRDWYDSTVGMRMADYQTYAENQALEDKLIATVTADVTVTEEDIRTKYASFTSEDAVVEAKEAYDGHPETCASDLQDGKTVCYRPTDYRMVKQILIRYDQAFQDEVEALQDEVNALDEEIAAMEAAASVEAAAETAGSAEAAVESVEAPTATEEAAAASMEAIMESVEAAIAAEGESVEAILEEAAASVEAAVPTLEDLKRQRAEKQAELNAKTEEAYASIQEEADAVVAAARAGEDWAALVAEHNDDPGMNSGLTAKIGYVIYEGMTGYDKPFADAALALENVGDISEPTRGAFHGLYIIRYETSLPAGVAALEEVREGLEEELQEEKTLAAYEALIAQWISEADIEMDLNRVKVD